LPPNHSSAFSAINATNGIHKVETAQSTPQRSEMSPLTSMENTPEVPHMAPANANIPILYQVPNDQRLTNALKRSLLTEGGMDANGETSAEAAARRGKRMKTGKSFLHVSQPGSEAAA
jgi:hypothetical protein